MSRGSGVALVIGSTLFVIAGAALWFMTGQLIGLTSLLFFGACLLTGILSLIDLTPRTRALATAGAAILMGAGCGALAVLGAVGGFDTTWRSSSFAAVIGGIGLIFFGGGGVVLLIRALRGDGRHRLR